MPVAALTLPGTAGTAGALPVAALTLPGTAGTAARPGASGSTAPIAETAAAARPGTARSARPGAAGSAAPVTAVGRRARGRTWLHGLAFVTEQRPAGQVQPSQVVNLLNHHGDFLADVNVGLDLAHFFTAEQSVLAGDELDEGAEVGETADLAGDDVAHHQLAGQALDAAAGQVEHSLVGGADGHAALVRNVNGAAGFLDDGPDDPAARPNYGANLFHRNLNANHLGGVAAHLRPGLRQGLVHLVQDVQPSLAGLFQGFAEDGFGESLNLAVHLEGVDTLGGAGDLEVHVAKEVFHALNIAEDGIGTTGLGNQPHGDAGHRGGDGHAGVHQGQGAAADAAHRGAAVGAEHLGDDADGIREFVFRGQHRHQGALGQGAVANLPPAWGANPPGLSGGVGGEIVVVHIPFGAFGTHGVQGLLHAQGCQGGDGQHLGLPAGEQAGAVGAGQHAGLRGYGANLRQPPAVGPDVLVQDAAADLGLDHRVEPAGDGVGGVLVGQFFGDGRLQVVQGLDPLGLHGVLFQHRGKPSVEVLVDALFQLFGLGLVRRNFQLGVAGPAHQVFNHVNGDLVGFVGLPDAFEDYLFGDLLGPGFHHDDGVAAAADHQVKLALGDFLVGRMDDVLVVMGPVGDAAGADGAVEGYLGDGQCRGSTNHGQDFRWVLLVGGEDGEDDLDFVVDALGEEGPDGAVGEAGGQDGFLTRPSFPPEEAAGNLAGGVEAFLVLHG